MRTRPRCIGLWLNDAEHDHLMRQCAATGLNANAHIRKLIMGENLRPRPPDAYAALQRANMEMGINNVSDVARNVPVENSIEVKTRSIMGTEIPLVRYDAATRTPVYAFYSTKESLDIARVAFEKVKDLTIKLSMVENSAYQLAANIKKAQKRANALKNITIPRYEMLTKNIANALEEKEREEFTRLKVIKRMHG